MSAVIALVPFFAPAAPYSWFIGTASAAARAGHRDPGQNAVVEP
nr:hypothetical protein [Amycolatopsis sp. BJA-103]